MKEQIIQFVNNQTNPTYGDIVAHLGTDKAKEIRTTIYSLVYRKEIFVQWDETSGYEGDYRIVTDKNLF